jgi:diguanylate cyclase (GGDEF)-like protein
VSKIGLRGALMAAFIVASGAPLAVFWLWPYAGALDGEYAAVRERHVVLARSVAESLARYRGDLEAAFEAAAPMMADSGEAGPIRDVLAGLHLRHVCVHDRVDGLLRWAVPLEGEPACPGRLSPADIAAAEALAADGEGRLSGIEASPDGSGGFRVAWSGAGRLVTAVLSPDYPRALTASITFGEKGHVVVVDRDGRVISHPRADWTAERRDLSALEPVRLVLAGETGVATFVSPALGVEVIAGFAPVPGTRWGVLAPQPLSEVRGRTQGVAAAALATLGAGLVLSVAIALVLSRHLSRSLGRVSGAAMRMARGENGVRLDPVALRDTVAELALLGRVFNTMARRIDAAHARVTSLARYDGLTGLPNRGAFLAEAGALLARSRESGQTYALFFIDVDRFKAVNDIHGHTVGDALLHRIGQRLQRIAGPDDLVARHSGDEFLLLHAKRRSDGCAALAARLLNVLNEPEQIGGRRIDVSVSIGLSRFPQDAADLNALVVQADQAMYSAKQQGRNQLRAYDAELRRATEEDVALRRELQMALGHGAVASAFQPIVRAGDGALAGFETLARWTSPSYGPIPPERFVRVAEDSGLIIALGRAVRRQAFAFAARLRRAGVNVPVSVNVSQLELAQRGFVDETEALLREHGLPPSAIVLELTESLFLEHSARELDGLIALRKRGLGLALDDFGKGFSSHGRLRTYPVDRLKIDLDFAGDVAADRQARAVVQSLVSLGRSLSMTVTVEGVETAEQRALAVAWGAEELQGYFHHAPMPEAAAFDLALAAVGGADVAQAG